MRAAAGHKKARDFLVSYDHVRVVGHGGHGAVHLVRHRGRGDEAVCKVISLPPDEAAHGELAQARWEPERGPRGGREHPQEGPL